MNGYPQLFSLKEDSADDRVHSTSGPDYRQNECNQTHIETSFLESIAHERSSRRNHELRQIIKAGTGRFDSRPHFIIEKIGNCIITSAAIAAIEMPIAIQLRMAAFLASFSAESA